MFRNPTKPILLLCALSLFSVTGCSASKWAYEAVDRVREFDDQQVRMQAEYAEERRMAEANRRAAEIERNRTRVDTLHSQLNMNMSQQMQMGQLEIDADELARVMSRRQEEYDREMELWREINETNQELHEAEYVNQVEQFLDARRAASEKNCAVPQKEAEANLPKLDAYQPAPLPVRRPITAAEVPFVVRVNMQVGLDSSGISRPEVVSRQPDFVRTPRETAEANRQCGRPPAEANRPDCAPDKDCCRKEAFVHKLKGIAEKCRKLPGSDE